MSDKTATSQEVNEFVIRLIAVESLMIGLLGVQEAERPGFCAMIAKKLDQQLGQQTESPHKEALVELRAKMHVILDQVYSAYAGTPKTWSDRLRRRLYGWPNRK